MTGAISDGENDSESVVLLILVGILLGAVTNYALSVWRNNSSFYHPLIFIEGIIIAELHQAANADFSISRAIESWVNVDSELLLYIFLPAIVFHDSTSVHWRQIKGALPQTMILSFPGVVAGSYLLGVACFLMLPLGFSWYEAMLLGTILSAIDPTAVIEEMHDSGASKKLIAMMLTEGIFTDGSAIMFFLLIYDIMSGSSISATGVIEYFAYEIFVSFAIGSVLGYLFVRFLRIFKRSLMAQDVFIQLALTLCSAYLSFFLGQSVFNVSGSWSCTATAIVVSWKGAPIILDHESMRIFWGVVVWLANTMIYLISGLIFSMRTLDNIEAINWLYLFLLYLVVLLVRAITVLASFPIIKDAGNRCSFKEALFIIIAASRGPPSLIMAILVEQNYEYLNISSEDANNIFFFVGGIVALSIIINVSNTEFMLQYLGLIEVESAEKMILIRQVRRQMKAKMENVLEHFMMKSGLRSDSIEHLRSMCSVFIEPDRLSITDMYFDPASRSQLSRVQGIENVGLHDRLLFHIRVIYYEIVRAQYWGHIADGKVPRQSYASSILLYSIDIALDSCKNNCLKDSRCLDDWFYIEDAIISNEKLTLTVLSFMDCSDFCRYLYGWHYSRKTKRAVYLLTCYIDAHERAKAKLHHFMSDDLENTTRLPEEDVIKSEATEAISRAKRMLADINVEQMHGIVEKQAARHILSKQTEFINEMLQEGMITGIDAQLFFKEISKDVKRIEKARKEMDRVQSRTTANLLRSSNASATSVSFRNDVTGSNDILTNLLPKI